VQNKKQRDTAAQDAEMRLKREAADKAEGEALAKAGNDKENTGSTDLLGDEDDADVIF
jgi:V-type H+-transporting ATPase subunit D